MQTSTRNKRLSQSQRYLGGLGTTRAYAVGEIGPDPRRTLFFIVAGVVAVALLSFLLYSVIIFPGVFLIWAVYVAVERTTGVVVTDRGVAVLARSEFNGRPRKLVALLPLEILTDPTAQRSGRYVHLSAYRLWLRHKEFETLTAAASTVQTVGQMVQQPARLGRQGIGGFEPVGVGVVNAAPLTGVRTQPVRSAYPPPRNSGAATESATGDSYWARQTGGSPGRSDCENEGP